MKPSDTSATATDVLRSVEARNDVAVVNMDVNASEPFGELTVELSPIPEEQR